MSHNNTPKLTQIDWGVIIVYITILTSLTLYTQIYIPWSRPAIPEKAHWLTPHLEVFITGEVENPGPYKMPPGSTRGDLLTLAKPLPTADLRKLKTSPKLRQGQLIEVPKITMITIHITGEVQEPTTLTLPKGTKLSEIQNKIHLTPHANTEQLQKKRPLKDGETITIKKKKK